MNKESEAVLPEEFLPGPWLAGQEVMQWLNISFDALKSWRSRGILAYTMIGGKILYNKPRILDQLKKGWTWKQRKKK